MRMRLDAAGIPYRQLNAQVREALAAGAEEIALTNVNGHRYIGTGLTSQATIIVDGTAGNDLAAFMDGPSIVVHGNAQDGVGNTMNAGRIVIHGHAGDVIGYAMRGGTILVEGNVGYRVGIHMKSFKKQVPKIVVGGTARDFFGEYMAGGVAVLLGLGRPEGEPLAGDYVGTGMHGGVIYVRGSIVPECLGQEVSTEQAGPEDDAVLGPLLEEYATEFSVDLAALRTAPFTKLLPMSSRPYGNMYAY